MERPRWQLTGLLILVGLAGTQACATGDEPVANEAASAPVAETAPVAEAAPAPEPGPEPKVSVGALPVWRERLRWSDVELTPVAAYDAEAAHTTYVSHCTSCHGLQGRGDGPAAPLMRAPPRDFADGLFKLRTRTGYPAPGDLYRSITAGFLSAGMPAYEHLPPDDRWQLVQHVTSLGRAAFVRGEVDALAEQHDQPPVPDFAPGAAAAFLDGEPGAEWPAGLRAAVGDDALRALEAEWSDDWSDRLDPGELVELSPSPAVSDALLARGAEVYGEWRCAQCHGPDGRGDGPSAATLVDNRGRRLAALELRSRAERFKGGARPEDIARTLATGMAGTPMPAYRLGPDSDPDLWALAHFVASWAAEAGR